MVAAVALVQSLAAQIAVIIVRPEKSCSLGKIIVMESLNDRKFDNLARFGEPHPAPVRRILV